MTRALVVPLTAWIGKYFIEQTLSWNQVYSMAVAIGGVFLGALVQLQNEVTDEQYNLTLFGLFILGLSALFQAMETMFENRLFKIEPELSSFTMQTKVALWKLIMVIVVAPFVEIIPAPGSLVEGGKMENPERAIAELGQSTTVQYLIAFQVLMCGLQSFLGVVVIREGNGVLKQAVTLLIIPIIWLFFLTYRGEGKETFDLTQLFGMVFVIGGTLWFIQADQEQAETLKNQSK